MHGFNGAVVGPAFVVVVVVVVVLVLHIVTGATVVVAVGDAVGETVGDTMGEAVGDSVGEAVSCSHIVALRPAKNALPPKSAASEPQIGLKAYPSLWYSLILDPSHVFRFAGAFDVLSPLGSFVSTTMENS